jgi:transposase
MKAQTKFKPEYTDELAEMFIEGKTLITVCAELRITKPTFYAWMKKYPDFAEAYELGKIFQKSWWMEKYRLWCIREVDGNGAGFIFYLKTQCQWSEYRDETKSPAEIAQQLAVAMERATSKTSPAPDLKIVK